MWSFQNALHCYGKAIFTGAVTLPSAAPTLATDAATKGYVDAAIASGGVNLAADYPWTGSHSFTKSLDVAIGSAENGKGLTLRPVDAAISPGILFYDEIGTDICNIGVARAAGAWAIGANLNDLMFVNSLTGFQFCAAAASYFAVNIGSFQPFNVTDYAVSIPPGGYLSVNSQWASGNNSRFYLVTSGMPEFALAFTNGTDSSVNFQTQPTGAGGGYNGNLQGKGISYTTVYGDYVIGRYVNETSVEPWVYFRDTYTPGGFGTVIVGQASSANQFFSCQLSGGGMLFAVAVNGNVTVAQDPVVAMAVATKQYVDNKFAAGVSSFNTRTGAVTLNSTDVTNALTYTPVNKNGDTMTGLLVLSADPSAALGAASKQYCDLKLLKSGGTMTGLLVLSADPSAALNPVTKQYADAKHAAATANGSNATVQTASELLTLSTAGLTTDTTANLLPAGAIILAVTARITTTITTTTDWKLGDATVADRFTIANATKTSGTTTIGLNQWIATRTTAGMGPDQAAAAKVRVTCTGSNPGAGAIRITVWYVQLTAPTS